MRLNYRAQPLIRAISPITFCFLLLICVAGFSVVAGAQQGSQDTVKITVQVLDPTTKEAKQLPKATQFQAGNPVIHLILPAQAATFQVLPNSMLILHADRRARFAIEHPDVLVVPPGRYVFSSDEQGIFQAKKVGSTAVTITYSAALPDCQNAPHCSPNWSGYVLLDSLETFTGVTGQWTVPTVAPNPHGASSTWVGIGGWKSTTNPGNSLIQAGTEQDYAPQYNPLSGATYYAWYDLLPGGQVKIPNKVSPGDVIQVSITPAPGTAAPPAGGTGKWLIKMNNLTQKWTYSTTQSYASDLSSAEWIEEATTEIAPVGPFSTVAMANYQQVEFNFNDQVATNNGALAPVYFVQGEQVWLNESGINGIYSTPSNPSGDGKGFYVTFTEGVPNQVFPPGPWIQTTSLPPAQVNQSYSQTLLVNEATSPVWSLKNGSLPPGLTLSSSGTISGTPSQLGPYGFSVAATDTSTGAATANVGLTIQVLADPQGALQVNCLGVTPPTAVLGFTIDGTPSVCNVAVNLVPGIHTVVASVMGTTQQYKYTYAGACGPSGQVTLTPGNTAMCSISATLLSISEGACPSGQRCCEPTSTGCAKCIPAKMSCP